MPFILDIDNDEYPLTGEEAARLETEGRIVSCDDCSSAFSGRAVYHPAGAGAEDPAALLASLGKEPTT